MASSAKPRRTTNTRSPHTALESGAQALQPDAAGLGEWELTALWLLGRVPAELLPWPLLRAGRAGRGPGADVREASFLLPSGVARSGDVEVHLRASDWARHGHDRDPAYRGVVLHLVWRDDLDGAGAVPAPTVAVGPALGFEPARLRSLLRRGPAGAEPCAIEARSRAPEATLALVRLEGRRRLAELSWRAAALAAEHGWPDAWRLLLDHALERSAGRRRERPEQRAQLAGAIDGALGAPVERALARLSEDRAALLLALRAGARLGHARALELGWNAALPLLAALATAYQDVALARRVARLAAGWPAPRPYGRTRALEALLLPEQGAGGAPSASARGMLWSQGLLHLQSLWCERGGCGACPLSRRPAGPARFASGP